MRSDYFLDYVLSYSGRSQMPKVNRKQLEGFTFPCPPIELQEKFTVLIDQSDKSKYKGGFNLAYKDLKIYIQYKYVMRLIT